MAPKLYMIYGSPPVRAVLITAKAIGLELDLQELNILEKENYQDWYLKMNPQHTVPTLLEEDGTTIWDSHAIMGYLIQKYAKDDSLYPKDPKKRALVDQRLHFESGVFFSQQLEILRPILYHGKKSIDQSRIDSIHEAYDFLEAFLGQTGPWFAGDSVTIADYSIFASLTSIAALIPVDSEKHPTLTAWIKRVQGLPGAEENKKGLAEFTALFSSLLA